MGNGPFGGHMNFPGPGDILVMVGTRKGSFFFWSDPARRNWQQSHHHDGWTIHAHSYDQRTGTIYAATTLNYLNERTTIQRSTDNGATWLEAAFNLEFQDDRRAWQIWQVAPGHPQKPGEVWAGTREAGLFRSPDGGETWKDVPGLNDHPSHFTWQPGGGGLLLHTILIDPENPERVYACISMGGAFRSEDGGQSWLAINTGVADGLTNVRAGTHQCVHKMALHPARPSVLFQQHHTGVYRSDDRGDHWVDISDGLSSRFGFPLAIHPHEPNTIYVIPHISEEERVVPDRRMAVWRSRDGGENWKSLTQGLPENAWITVLREGLAVDDCDPAGVYAGTNTGQVFYSRDEGENWDLLADYLPAVISVNTARIIG